MEKALDERNATKSVQKGNFGKTVYFKLHVKIIQVKNFTQDIIASSQIYHIERTWINTGWPQSNRQSPRETKNTATKIRTSKYKSRKFAKQEINGTSLVTYSNLTVAKKLSW